jgi:hypothetical protein
MTNGLFSCCKKKKHAKVQDAKEREDIAKRRWRKIGLLRNLITAVDE